MLGSDRIFGTLKYVTGYTGFSSKTEEQSGNYLALHCEVPGVSGVTIRCKMTKAVTLDADGDIIFRVADKDTQTITVVAYKEGYDAFAKVYDLKGLTCETE